MKLHRMLAPLLLVCGAARGALALWFGGPSSTLLTAGSAGAGMLSLICVRPCRCVAVALGILVMAGCTTPGPLTARRDRVRPKMDRDWQPDVAKLPVAEIEGSRVIIRNVRNFDYRTADDFTECWETRTYDLDALVGMDLFISYWGSRHIAHTIASWEFADGAHLAISIETRKEKGESYSALRGFFRTYELYYVVGDERDVIGVRASHRGERLYLYRLTMAPDRARAILLDYLREVNSLSERPRWYNALTRNCTTSIRHHIQNVAPANPWNWRILLNGHLDELGYARGTIDTSMPFPELRRRSDITEKAQAADLDPDFSKRIREGLPGGHSDVNVLERHSG